jgi:hypothetical protein
MRAEVVTNRFDVAFGSLSMLQLHALDEWHNDQGVIRMRTAKMHTTLVYDHFIFRICFDFLLFRLAKIERNEMAKIVLLAVQIEVNIELFQSIQV